MWTILTEIGGQFVKGWLNGMRNKQEIERARAEAQIAREHKIAQAEIDWDIEWARQAQGSWKDEFFTLILTAPLLAAAFYPDRVRTMFVNLEVVPLWWIAAWTVSVSAAFGYRKLVNLVLGLLKR